MTDREALMRDALTDILSGWKYIRSFHGDLYGVGWDRAQEKAERALAALAAPPQPTNHELIDNDTICRLAQESEIETDLWCMGSGSLVYSKHCSGIPRFEFEAFARAVAQHVAPPQAAQPQRCGRVKLKGGRVQAYAFEQTDIADGCYELHAVDGPHAMLFGEPLQPQGIKPAGDGNG